MHIYITKKIPWRLIIELCNVRRVIYDWGHVYVPVFQFRLNYDLIFFISKRFDTIDHRPQQNVDSFSFFFSPFFLNFNFFFKLFFFRFGNFKLKKFFTLFHSFISFFFSRDFKIFFFSVFFFKVSINEIFFSIMIISAYQGFCTHLSRYSIVF